MSANTYESAVIINAALEDDQIEEMVIKIKDLIESNGGKIVDLDRWGRKRLAYMINKNRIGYYVIYQFEAPAPFIKELERIYRLDENIIRYMTIKLEKNALEYFADKRAKVEREAELEKEAKAEAEAEKKEAEQKEAEKAKETEEKSETPEPENKEEEPSQVKEEANTENEEEDKAATEEADDK